MQNKRLSAVIRFVVDNPGWWMFHCHIQIDQSTGLAAVIRELPNELSQPPNDECTPSSSNPRGSPLMMTMGIIVFFSL